MALRFGRSVGTLPSQAPCVLDAAPLCSCVDVLVPSADTAGEASKGPKERAGGAVGCASFAGGGRRGVPADGVRAAPVCTTSGLALAPAGAEPRITVERVGDDRERRCCRRVKMKAKASVRTVATLVALRRRPAGEFVGSPCCRLVGVDTARCASSGGSERRSLSTGVRGVGVTRWRTLLTGVIKTPFRKASASLNLGTSEGIADGGASGRVVTVRLPWASCREGTPWGGGPPSPRVRTPKRSRSCDWRGGGGSAPLLARR